jgi:hypothetical protein
MIPPRGYSVAAVSFPLRSENRETVELFNKTVGVHRDISVQVGGKEWRLTLAGLLHHSSRRSRSRSR